MPDFAQTPPPPYYAVIFTSKRADLDGAYEQMAAVLAEKVRSAPGCLGYESARGADGFGITVAYFADEASIAAWKADALHREAQRLGKTRWYEKYHVRIARVEREYEGP
ncbi:antibiotic biosynthesis monooxygenase family protein [Methylocystis heyeri]|uniref:Antibiotic biosynthesis monooxygenase n=1 Tax=Methylocystis heyeri TaxID=391905 RepID=A0A6B8KLJ0_9HYPH|nr:antibiotic biosynthesis monooxygenase [Methylocystis heyeri]QGM47688.1 antibiotic biosynthesis monooxygenase [Methylocystis heyeri]